MKNLKIASTPERAPATRNADSTQLNGTEQATVFNHLLQGKSIHTDKAFKVYGIKHLHSIIPALERRLPISRKVISRPHPKHGRLREINEYWVEDKIIAKFRFSAKSREDLRKAQLKERIIKTRIRNNKLLEIMCLYCLKSTMESKLNKIYGGMITKGQ